MDEVRTFCRVCEPACGLVARVDGGELVGLRPDKEHPVSQGFACNKGLATLEIHRDPDRLGFPLRRTASGRFERASWDDAIDDISERLKAILAKHGPKALGYYIGNPTAFNSQASNAAGAFFAQLGTRLGFSSGTQDCANKFAGSEAVFGSSTIHPVPDIDHTDYLLIFGENPRVSHMSFFAVADPMRQLKEARRRGATIRFINPREIESAGPDTGDVVLIRPDTDLYLLAAMLCEIDATVGFNERAVREHGKRVDELREFVRAYPAERAARVTGIPAETIRQLAREFAAAPSASVHMSTGVNMGRHGTLCYWLLHMLCFVTGNLDRRGGNLKSDGFYPNARSGRRRYEEGFADGPWGPMRRGSLPGNVLPDAIEGNPPIRAFFVMAGNPVLSIGGEARMRRAFESLELLVSLDIYRNATGELADWLLPCTDMYERADINITGLGLQHRPYAHFTERVVQPRDERREEWWIFARLCQELGLKSPLDGGPEPDVWGRVAHMLRASGIALEELRAREPSVAVLPEPEPGRFYDDVIQTDDSRVDCCPVGFADALERAERIFQEHASGSDGLLLITKRDAYMVNSWFHNVAGMKRGDRDRNWLFVHPDDARARGLDDGALVRVQNEHGSIEVPVRLDDGLMRGVVALTHGWGNARTPGMRVAHRSPGANANALSPTGPGSFDPLSNQAHMTGIPVELELLASAP